MAMASYKWLSRVISGKSPVISVDRELEVSMARYNWRSRVITCDGKL